MCIWVLPPTVWIYLVPKKKHCEFTSGGWSAVPMLAIMWNLKTSRYHWNCILWCQTHEANQPPYVDAEFWVFFLPLTWWSWTKSSGKKKKTVWLNETTVSAQHEVSHLEMVNVWNNFGWHAALLHQTTEKNPRQYYKSYLPQICCRGSSLQMGLPKICGLIWKKSWERFWKILNIWTSSSFVSNQKSPK